MKLIVSLLLVICLLPAPGHSAGINDLPTAYDVVMLAGADYQLDVKHVDPAGAVVNLTGSTFVSQFWSAPAPAGTVFATYSTPIVSAVAGTSRVKLSKAQTTALSGRSGVWDLLWTDATGRATFLLSGKAAVRPTVSR